MSDQASTSQRFRLRVWGRNACFTRPEMKVERVSYDVMTPSAARGVLEAILWKPAIRWVVERVDVLKPIRWESVRRNEVRSVMSPGSPCLFVEDRREQRAGLLLRDVDYVIHAHFDITAKAEAEDTLIKFQEMFVRRATKGQCFHRPYLGCREFAADFSLLGDGHECPSPIPETRDLGFILYDMDFSELSPLPLWFRARMKGGVIQVPPLDSPEVRR